MNSVTIFSKWNMNPGHLSPAYAIQPRQPALEVKLVALLWTVMAVPERRQYQINLESLFRASRLLKSETLQSSCKTFLYVTKKRCCILLVLNLSNSSVDLRRLIPLLLYLFELLAFGSYLQFFFLQSTLQSCQEKSTIHKWSFTSPPQDHESFFFFFFNLHF